MRTIAPTLLAALLYFAHSEAGETNERSFLAESPASFEVQAAAMASFSGIFIKELECPERLMSARVFVAKYPGGGQEPSIGRSVTTGSSNWKWKLLICASVREQEPPRYNGKFRSDWNLATTKPGIRNRGYDDWERGTGSTFLGVSVFAHSTDVPSSEGNSVSEIIKHSEIDMMTSQGPFDCAKLPFKIETQATLREHAIPVFVWFPMNFDVSAKREKLTFTEMPKGSVIVYAVVNEKVTAE